MGGWAWKEAGLHSFADVRVSIKAHSPFRAQRSRNTAWQDCSALVPQMPMLHALPHCRTVPGSMRVVHAYSLPDDGLVVDAGAAFSYLMIDRGGLKPMGFPTALWAWRGWSLISQ